MTDLLHHPHLLYPFGGEIKEKDIINVFFHLKNKIRGIARFDGKEITLHNNIQWVEDKKHLQIRMVERWLKKKRFIANHNDPIDIKIIRLLEQDKTQAEIAKAVGISQTRISRRIRKITQRLSLAR